MAVTFLPQFKNAWGCKIGGRFFDPLPSAADAPLRDAVEAIYFQITGVQSEFCYSGWSDKISPAKTTMLASQEVERLRAAGLLDEVVRLAQADKLLGIE